MTICCHVLLQPNEVLLIQQEECEETAGHKWCPTETEMSRCFDTADASKQTEYCECSGEMCYCRNR